MTRPTGRYALLLCLSMAGAVVSCSGTSGEANDPSKEGSAKRDTEITHEDCDLSDSDAQVLDADANGRPEIVRVFDGGREVCRAVDINRDTLIDVFVYFDDQGRERRREYGFDRDDRPDEIDIFENGQLVRKERETNNDQKIDTWDYYQGGRLVREERDSAGDGYVDQWWTFHQPDRPNCAIVISDIDGNGKPDEESKVDLCADGDTPLPSSPAKQPESAGDGPAAGASTPADSETSSSSPASGTGGGAPAGAAEPEGG